MLTMPAKVHPEYQYLNLLKDILDHGTWKISHSTGVKLKSVFGRQMHFDLSQGFPLLTTKKVFLRGIIHELIWFLSGESNIRYLVENDVHIWDDWAYKPYKKLMDQGKVKKMNLIQFIDQAKKDKKFMARWCDIGPVYGVQWRRWPTESGRTIDQLAWVIDKIKKFPQKKHYLVSAWNPANIYEMAKTREDSMAIAPCHTLYHVNITAGKLSLQLYQRSADMFLGVPFNIASYSLLTLILAQVTGYKPGEFVHTFGDAHIYQNHFDQVKLQLKRKPRPFPKIKINPKVKSIDDFKFEDFEVAGYHPHPPIKGKITVVGGF
ncbi:MAG: Thymidylate synthase [Candidatus Beckwithbacteria bacterium GW2011_GWB1_47_15]|uniref:Thymidylate synthase n=1 Tax=Candidatus Beckwithbacteria bacterium GW2011_GWB1_47_15 TaxID=1618371 RepID=A0A0G1RTJ6_9BACT|nr:MAG: Thymidylate synthase [Candidatus Beckwithbacteria bacterium GW2011_GWA1_46_30]KKU60426.1 MAG: Thymidylate synthase [Candidatus Beckwithbacteria bacterium GW2011_GWB1_47_15]